MGKPAQIFTDRSTIPLPLIIFRKSSYTSSDYRKYSDISSSETELYYECTKQINACALIKLSSTLFITFRKFRVLNYSNFVEHRFVKEMKVELSLFSLPIMNWSKITYISVFLTLFRFLFFFCEKEFFFFLFFFFFKKYKIWKIYSKCFVEFCRNIFHTKKN